MNAKSFDTLKAAPTGDRKELFEVATPTATSIVDAATSLLELLDERSREVLGLRFGFRNDRPLTLQAIGDRMRLTRERIRQIEAHGMRVLGNAKDEVPEQVRATRSGLRTLLVSLGGAALEKTVLETVGGKTPHEIAALRLLLASMPDVAEARETQRTHAHWTVSERPAAGPDMGETGPLEGVLENAEKLLERYGQPMRESEMFTALRKEIGFPADLTDRALRSLLAVGKRIVRTPLGDWGLRGWPEATPRSAGDKAYIVLKRAGKPLHFSAIAEEMNRLRFIDGKRTHPQTVHNELIRSHRFVLVGRGMYGLREWGYEAGTVAEVLVRLLSRAGHPLARQELVEATLRERFVKRNTVILSLQNRRLFRLLPDGTYMVATTADRESTQGERPLEAAGELPATASSVPRNGPPDDSDTVAGPGP